MGLSSSYVDMLMSLSLVLSSSYVDMLMSLSLVLSSSYVDMLMSLSCLPVFLFCFYFLLFLLFHAPFFIDKQFTIETQNNDAVFQVGGNQRMLFKIGEQSIDMRDVSSRLSSQESATSALGSELEMAINETISTLMGSIEELREGSIASVSTQVETVETTVDGHTALIASLSTAIVTYAPLCV